MHCVLCLATHLGQVVASGLERLTNKAGGGSANVNGKDPTDKRDEQILHVASLQIKLTPSQKERQR